MVEGIVRIGFVKQVNESVNDRVNVEDGFPVFAQNVEAHLALQVNVWVVNLGLAFHLWGGMGIVGWNDKGKVVGGGLPVA